ncbi:MAG: lytic transglycosylase domain-containing protein [Pyrinomonadaceae bacterium]
MAHGLRTARIMRKQTCIVSGLLILGSLITPLTLLSQSRPVLTRTALSRIDVLSRAELFEQTIAEAARKEGVDPLILWTIAYNETRFRPWLTSPKNAQGLMQFMPATASRFGLKNAYDPTASINAAALYVKYLGGLFDWRLESVLAAYNAGEGTVFAYLNGRKIVSNGRVINPSCRQTPGGVPPYSETINYVSKGMSIYRWLEAQGRLGRTPHVDSVSKTVAPEPKHRKEKRETLEVLYDPRSGSRFLIDINANKILRPIDRSGPIIISPELRGLPAQRARTTFAGIIKPEKK